MRVGTQDVSRAQEASPVRRNPRKADHSGRVREGLAAEGDRRARQARGADSDSKVEQRREAEGRRRAGSLNSQTKGLTA